MLNNRIQLKKYLKTSQNSRETIQRKLKIKYSTCLTIVPTHEKGNTVCPKLEL